MATSEIARFREQQARQEEAARQLSLAMISLKREQNREQSVFCN